MAERSEGKQTTPVEKSIQDSGSKTQIQTKCSDMNDGVPSCAEHGHRKQHLHHGFHGFHGHHSHSRGHCKTDTCPNSPVDGVDGQDKVASAQAQCQTRWGMGSRWNYGAMNNSCQKDQTSCPYGQKPSHNGPWRHGMAQSQCPMSGDQRKQCAPTMEGSRCHGYASQMPTMGPWGYDATNAPAIGHHHWGRHVTSHQPMIGPRGCGMEAHRPMADSCGNARSHHGPWGCGRPYHKVISIVEAGDPFLGIVA